MSELFAPQIFELPSKGWFYPETSPLSSGKVELRFPTAKDEDILMNSSYLKQGVAIDKFIEALLIDKSIFPDLLSGDKDAILFAARILAYGEEYPVKIICSSCGKETKHFVVNLNSLDTKAVNMELPRGINEFTISELPITKKSLKFKLLSNKEEQNLTIARSRLVEQNIDISEWTLRFKSCILELDGSADREVINKFVDNLLARDAQHIKNKYFEISPEILTKFNFTCKYCKAVEEVELFLDAGFLWPSAHR